jgi:hypothetical protein
MYCAEMGPNHFRTGTIELPGRLLQIATAAETSILVPAVSKRSLNIVPGLRLRRNMPKKPACFQPLAPATQLPGPMEKRKRGI